MNITCVILGYQANKTVEHFYMLHECKLCSNRSPRSEQSFVYVDSVDADNTDVDMWRLVCYTGWIRTSATNSEKQ
jgi:hypothetical protein